ncbi:MAG: CapA family protein, partial [Eubacteriales bacterium]
MQLQNTFRDGHHRGYALIAFFLSVILLIGLVSCRQIGDTEDTDAYISYISVPLPEEEAEENAILRRPDSVADPSDYAVITEAPETETTAPSGTDIDAPSSDSGETRISFVAVGDNIIHSAIMEDAANHAKDGAEYDFTYIYDHVRDTISAADVAFVNQETPMGGKSLGYYGYPNFNGPQEAGDALVDCGFDIVCIATNHMADLKDAG